MVCDLFQISKDIEDELNVLFQSKTGLSEREDSRAFGAMVQKSIEDSWAAICTKREWKLETIVARAKKKGVADPDKPGRKSIFDCACIINGQFIGLDISTTDLDDKKYADGGITSVHNALRFHSTDKAQLLIAEFGHKRGLVKGTRDITHIKVAPFICLPKEIYGIENLGTGQIRFKNTLNNVVIEWKRSKEEFFNMFCPLVKDFYKHVAEVALSERISDIENFEKVKYEKF